MFIDVAIVDVAEVDAEALDSDDIGVTVDESGLVLVGDRLAEETLIAAAISQEDADAHWSTHWGTPGAHIPILPMSSQKRHIM